jgi:predicted ArsR family transcriptional regulator
MTMKKRILEILEQAPASSADVAAELRTSMKLASSHLCRLEERGLIKCLRKLAPPKGTGGRPAKLFATLETRA